MSVRMHGTAVRVGRHGVMLIGASGSGKSDLALRLIDRGARLIADDQMLLFRRDGHLIAGPVPGGEGLIEVRGLGILRLSQVPPTKIMLAVTLGASGARLPGTERLDIAGGALPHLRLDATHASAPILVELALNGDLLPID